MMTKLTRYMFLHRSCLKRFIPIRRPLLVKLADFRIFIRLDDWAVGARIAVKRSYEAHVTNVLRSYLKPGMTVVDIGANIGYYSLFAASIVGDKGKVIAFEPSRQNCDLLQMSLIANNFGNVAIHACAVADSEGIVGFSMDDSNGVISRGNPMDSTYQVCAVRLDSFLKNEPRIDLIKMDIEGAEGLAINGMRNLIQRNRPIIFTEFNPSAIKVRSNIDPRHYLDILWGLGYELFVIDRKRGKDTSPQTYEQIMQHFADTASEHLDLIADPTPPAGRYS